MKYFGSGLREKHKELQRIIRQPGQLRQAKNLFCQIHTALHTALPPADTPTEVDALLGDLRREEYAIMPTSRDETIAWVLWHTARIEDLTMNRLVGQTEPVFSTAWQRRLHIAITDTGNALSDDEIMDLSCAIDHGALLDYRKAVALRTRQVVEQLDAHAMRRKTDPADLQKILEAGGVTTQADSSWLLDFWGKKDVAGLLLMPATRHVMLHLNDCCQWKQIMRSKKSLYRTPPAGWLPPSP